MAISAGAYEELKAILQATGDWVDDPPAPIVERMKFEKGTIVQSKSNPAIHIKIMEYVGAGWHKGLPFSEAAKQKYKNDTAMCGNNNWVEVTQEV